MFKTRDLTTSALLGAALLGVAGSASAAPVNIVTRFRNTGVEIVSPTGPGTTALAAGTADPHYSLTTVPFGAPSIPLTMTPHPVWKSDAEGGVSPFLSRWIGPFDNGTTDAPAGLYVYHYTFDLTGYDASTVAVTGRWSSDNGATMKLNGTLTGNGTVEEAFRVWTPFSLPLGSSFVSGVNTLDFLVDNVGSTASPSGLRVEYLTATAADPVPEPFTMALAGGALAMAVRRRRK